MRLAIDIDSTLHHYWDLLAAAARRRFGVALPYDCQSTWRTARWLDRIGLHHDELYCSYDKLARCRELEIDVLIDDSPANILGALEQGILPATIAHPWNRDVCEAEQVLCAEDWPGLAALLDPVLAGRRVA